MGQEVQIKRGETPARHRSLFWPIVLISLGVIWLLGNLGVFTSANLRVLGQLWPLILIIIGLELLIGRNSPALSVLIGIGGVVLLFVLMLIGPSMGWAEDVQVKTESFSEPVGDATSARVSLNLGVADTTITPLSDSTDLISADLRYIGEVEFVAEGETEKVISLSQTDEGNDGSFTLFGLGWVFQEEDLDWNIGLSPEVPIDLSIKGGVGASNFDLSELQITDLDLSSGVGEINLSLPATSEPLDAQVSGGVGKISLTIPEGTGDINVDINGGVGETTIDVPDDAGVRIEVNTGVGVVNLPSSFTRTSGDDDNIVGENGAWQSENFAEADQQIIITYKGGVGSLNVQ
jgi:hypothetical protein